MDVAETRKAKAWKTVILGLSAVIGVATVWYAERFALFPVLIFVVLVWAGDKVLKPAKPLSLSINLQMADVLVLAVVLILPNVTGKLGIAIYVILAGFILFWLARYPSIIAAVLITILQIGFSVGMVENLLTAGYGTPPHRTAVVHLAARLLGLILMGVGLYEIATGTEEPETPDEESGPQEDALPGPPQS